MAEGQAQQGQNKQGVSSVEGESVQNKDALIGGPGGGRQVKPARKLSGRDLKAQILHEPDRDLHPDGDPEHAADRTSAPGPVYPPVERPPVSTTRHDEPVLQSLVTGAGAHEPPDPEKYDAAGRWRADES